MEFQVQIRYTGGSKGIADAGDAGEESRGREAGGEEGPARKDEAGRDESKEIDTETARAGQAGRQLQEYAVFEDDGIRTMVCELIKPFILPLTCFLRAV